MRLCDRGKVKDRRLSVQAIRIMLIVFHKR
jgi:hypothetical protein